MDRLLEAVTAAQKRAISKGLTGDAVLSAVTADVGVVPRELPNLNDHHAVIAENIPCIGSQILFDPSLGKPTCCRKSSMPDRLINRHSMRKVVLPAFAILATAEFGELVFALDCLVYPRAAAFFSRYITSPRARSRKDADILPTLPIQAQDVWGDECGVDEALERIDRWYVVCAFAAYTDEMGAFPAVIRALRMVGASSEEISDVYQTLGCKDASGLKNESWDLNMMAPLAVVWSHEGAAACGLGEGHLPAEAAKFFPRPSRFFAGKNVFDEAAFQQSAAVALECFHIDEATIRMTSAIHWYDRDEVNVKTILRLLCQEILNDGPDRETAYAQAVDWALKLGSALRSDLECHKVGEEDRVPVFRLFRKQKK